MHDQENDIFIINVVDNNTLEIIYPLIDNWYYGPPLSTLFFISTFVYFILPSLALIVLLWFCWKRGPKTLGKKA